MVMAAVKLDQKNEVNLKSLGVKDSKLLSPLLRERLFSQLTESIKYKVIIISPKKIDEALASKSLNLNWLEACIAAELINSIKPDKVILDCPSNNINAFRDYVEKKLKFRVELIAEHKADLNHPVVAAASIIAKVTRDNEINKLKRQYNVDFGSGYPSDPLTRQFLEKNFDKFDFFRKSWVSYQRVAKVSKQSALSSFD